MVGFSDLFSKSGRRIINAKYDYEKCERLIKDSKASFRQNFARDIIFQYPDCKILMNHCDDTFFALIPSKRSFLYGGFADYYFPYLLYSYNENKVNLAELSVREFKEEISDLIGVISNNYKSELERGLMSTPDEFHTFINKGYMVTDEISLEDIAGGALFLDGEQIALSSVFHTQPKGHFTQALLTDVIDGGERNPNIRSLVFKTAKCNILNERMGFGIEYLYNKSLIAFDPDAKRDFINYITQLRDFLYAIEDFYNGISPGTNEDRSSWMSSIVEDILFDSSSRREIPLLV